MKAPAQFVEQRQVRRNFARAASTYDEVAVLQREIGSRMLERLDYVRIEPQRVLDLGCGTGASLTALREHYPKALLLGVDLCAAMLQAGQAQRSRLRYLLPFLRGRQAPLLVADAACLPLPRQSIDLVWSNLMLHWLDDPLAVFREVHRLLAINGLLMFSTFGPDTLKELRASFADGYVHTQRFTDLHDYGDMLVECGFTDPVMDAEVLTMTYASFDDLLNDLRRSGSTCAMRARRHGLMGRSAWAAARAAYPQLAHSGRLPATVEVVYGHAWKAPPRKTADGRAIVRFDPRQRMR
ncbi:MAG: malonyl-ACP O-methyltransferase BioC [Candidatus Accumulibacter phosphatis]|jgi:malonyl-CoA O-methyltransferase|uniref:Malonyl-[acyl-carrier protein] O-methyltransferase n=2 Tax=Candidatus Accumulibacter TaxID=327159 RepID=A0A080LSS1_9PROT|nr:malonyl-ACP O-methyltransferase BioC [Candidatus Accumulibacter contiguus]KFB71502.1 MAG: Malonyl-CoA O-methyltransferase BioC [Candidatus Accumulibacter phosphatis]MBL8408543.1 malonyl-ACP O-methyltransferase BioC [Accumulibacter sp.]NMQ03860.1 malonyl-[acyl-carrier protein] O-methyltransferase BioC [Candidatus Accumulibacter contiguus]HRF13330.1 malonyl-ACP O-methyltransferase BioC [Candidatus Accumulibacter phosphatis]